MAETDNKKSIINRVNKIAPAIGIDLGTTYSCVAVCKDGRPDVIFDENGTRIMPSCVAYTEDSILVGEAAELQMFMNPQNTIYDSKRLIGHHSIDELSSRDVEIWPFKLVQHRNKVMIELKYKKSTVKLHPEEISAQILLKLKKIAENRLDAEVKYAVITVPAYFNNAQRQATRDAGIIAGLDVLRIIQEPTAAALAYGLDEDEPKNIIVYDLGGGTFDVTVFNIEDGVFEVLATAGCSNLGGQDFTNTLLEHCKREIISQQETKVIFTSEMIARLKSECEKAKKTLSFKETCSIHFKYEKEIIPLCITRTCFEELNMSIFEKTLYSVEKALLDANIDECDIDEIILVGGSTRIPKIKSMLKEKFNNCHINSSQNPDECVALGAAIQAANISKSIDENVKNITLLDVTPFSLGIKKDGGLMSTIINRNSQIPIRKNHRYATKIANQTSALIEIYEGESTIAHENNKLGVFELKDLPKSKAGEIKVDVVFEIDVNGVLKVSAEEITQSSKNSITVDCRFNTFSHIDINRMTKEMRSNKHEYLKKKQYNETISKLENLCHQIDSDCLYDTHKLSKHNQILILEKVYDNLEWLKNNPHCDEGEYEARYEKLSEMYKKFKIS